MKGTARIRLRSGRVRPAELHWYDAVDRLGLGELGIEAPVKVLEFLDACDLGLLEAASERAVGAAVSELERESSAHRRLEVCRAKPHRGEFTAVPARTIGIVLQGQPGPQPRATGA
jgi:hypothetical protein